MGAAGLFYSSEEKVSSLGSTTLPIMMSSPLTWVPGEIKPSISSLSYGPCFNPDVYLISGFLILAFIDSTSL